MVHLNGDWSKKYCWLKDGTVVQKLELRSRYWCNAQVDGTLGLKMDFLLKCWSFQNCTCKANGRFAIGTTDVLTESKRLRYSDFYNGKYWKLCLEMVIDGIFYLVRLPILSYRYYHGLTQSNHLPTSD
ncbi:unnamed protein product [Bursaphelenchus okinawaensis]|uniref:Uncharacterized protein n=1 Tax=Bursaphelenchus okinawaensis TaxID=465554 RepID=A0A811L1T3_9BILA|nr:unnamed protein product [Bursaphelenchus okinawaensis]CAG9115326.1 unnamed protein product [Bursaphelenchus okinawaensis]